MSERKGISMKRFLEQRPTTPTWPEPEAGFTANTWREKEVSEKEISEKEPVFVKKHNLNSSLTALSASPDHNYVVVAGREVLKVLSVSERGIIDEYNLRNKNFKYFNDVKWGNASTKNKIATAATNGSIFIWDIGNGRKIDRKIGEHSRAVNRICFSPMNGSILLSASQDFTMKLWDLREPDPAKITFEGKCENVRDVQFNSGNPNDFVAAFENGAIQKWDIRKPTIHERKLNAHIGTVLAVDWHSDGKTVASGGRDKSIKIWDMNSDNRRPKYIIQSMTSISRVQWRPNSYEIASCALWSDNRIFVWDITRPFIANYYFEEHEDVPTGFLWHDPDVLWSCSKDKLFIQQSIEHHSYRQLDLLSKCGIGWSIKDDIAFAIGKPDDSTPEDRSIPPNQLKNMQRGMSPSITNTRIEVQQTGVASLTTFDHKAFSHLAERYKISSDDILSVCEHNAKTAWEVKRFRTSQTWKIIQLLYGILEPVDHNDKENTGDNMLKDSPIKSSGQKKEPDSTKNLNTVTEKHKEDDEDLYSDEEEFEGVKEPNVEEVQQPRQTTIKMTTHMVQTTYNSTLCQNWNKESIIMQLLDYYAEQSDVQMCVTLTLVLGDRIKISQERVEQWFFSYIELLHRFQLWCAATYIISSCRIPSVEIMNQQSTTVYTTCNNCQRPIINSKCSTYWVCDKCRKTLNPCSICHKIVKGLYTWCQGCSHGGHLAHMKEWFSENKECPTGCGHNCSGVKDTKNIINQQVMGSL